MDVFTALNNGHYAVKLALSALIKPIEIKTVSSQA